MTQIPEVAEHRPRLSITRIIDHEFRGLSVDRALTTMSAFDLIDHCSQLFEKLVKLRGTQRGLRRYVRAYLIFTYSITTFIMVHFEGFARFMENSHTDFVIYLNLYEFFRSDKVLGSDAFSVNLQDARESVLEYLYLKELLSFDAEELFGWLDDYVAYLQDDSSNRKELDVSQSFSPQVPPSPDFEWKSVDILPSKESTGSAGFLDDDGSINDLDDFRVRFPEILVPGPIEPTPYPTKLLIPVPLLTDISGVGADSDKQNSKRLSWSLSESLEPPLIAPPPVPRHGSHLSSYGSANGPTRAPPPVPLVPPVPLTFKSHTQPNGFSPIYNEKTNAYSDHREIRQPQFPSPSRSVTQTGQTGLTYPPVPLLQGVPQSRIDPNQNHGISQIYVRQPSIQSPHRPNTIQYYGDHQKGAQPHHGSKHHSAAFTPQRPPNNGDNRVSKTQWMHANSVCGLKNLGSSCYINLTIQMLVGLERFNDLFYYRINEWLTSGKKNTLAESTASLVATFNSNGGANIAPTKFLKVLAKLKPDFNIPNEQQDAQELLLFILDRLHEDLAHKPSHPDMDYISTWDINVNPSDREKYLEWYRGLVKHEGESQVNDMCQGHVQHKLICNKCSFSSISYSPFTILSLPIPHANKEGVDLTDCLRYYTQDEVLSGENAWKCPKCNKTESNKENPMDVVFEQKRGLFRFSKRSKSPSKKPSATAPNASTISIKQLSFIKLPPVLFIHLSRFHMFNLTDKLDTDIAYPLRLLFNRQDHEITYVLRGLVNHYGNLNGGHYTSIVKKTPRMAADEKSAPVWCSFDDDHVRINVPYGNPGVSPNKVHSRDVYVLCYERV